MIGTLETKQQQLNNTAFRTGSGKEIILIMGSCRSVPYLNYLNDWNNTIGGNRFTIYFIDPFNWNWNIKDEMVDYNEEIEKLEYNEVLLTILSSINIFIHEYYQSFGMFNTIDNGEKNIYDFGMNPEMDICIPNFNDLFILFNDIISFSADLKSKALNDYEITGELSKETQREFYNIGQKNIDKFCSICQLSDIPEMENLFRNEFLNRRFFWTSNHVSKHFTLAIFSFINDKFLKLNLSDDFIANISKEDMYANSYTYLTKYDLNIYNYKWNEEFKPLNIKP